MKRIAYKNLPVRYPIVPTLAWWLLLDRLDVGGVAWGVFYTVSAIIWAIIILAVFKTKQIDIFE